MIRISALIVKGKAIEVEIAHKVNKENRKIEIEAPFLIGINIEAEAEKINIIIEIIIETKILIILDILALDLIRKLLIIMVARDKENMVEIGGKET